MRRRAVSRETSPVTSLRDVNAHCLTTRDGGGQIGARTAAYTYSWEYRKTKTGHAIDGLVISVGTQNATTSAEPIILGTRPGEVSQSPPVLVLGGNTERDLLSEGLSLLSKPRFDSLKPNEVLRAI